MKKYKTNYCIQIIYLNTKMYFPSYSDSDAANFSSPLYGEAKSAECGLKRKQALFIFQTILAGILQKAREQRETVPRVSFET